MNTKEDILNAWIMIEQLSEGSINKKEKSLIPINTETDDLYNFFCDFLNKQKQFQKVSDKAFQKSGLVLYFDIFNFQEIINILRKKYSIRASFEETSNSDKFTFCLYFDNELNFLKDKLFHTMSGYIRIKGELPEDFLKEENSFRDNINKDFDDGFNITIAKLFKEYKVSSDNFRYSFVKDLDNTDVNLHSFFINDLKKAKKINNENLNRFFNGFSEFRQNLNGKKDSKNFNPKIFEDILQPNLYPMGRFPSNPDHMLSFMQQVAVNLALNNINTIRSVNGPPGTGKTTLLKDIFADLVVQQAYEICNLSDKTIKGSVTYWDNAKLGILPYNISDKNMIVASSNNGAVQNIVNELPKKEGVSEDFLKLLEEADYFKDISNSEIFREFIQNKLEIKSKLLNKSNWGIFSLEGGASTNVTNLLSNIELIEKYLEDYQSNPSVYEEFLYLYSELVIKRSELQKYSEQIRPLPEMKNQFKHRSDFFKQEKSKRQIDLIVYEKEINSKIEVLKQKKHNLQNDLLNVAIELENLDGETIQAERNYDVISSQRPSLLWLQKIFNKSKVQKYFLKLNEANENLNNFSNKKTKLLNNHITVKNELEENINKSNHYQQLNEDAKDNFKSWINNEQNALKNLEQKIKHLENIKSQRCEKELDFSLSYDELQKSNPWFIKKLRILQSELFISALKVRKQFLFENKKNLKAARKIWNGQSEYIAKENGMQLISISWQWLNFAIPVVSTTFASFGRMFKNLKENSIGNLFIDEAGQALPQASVGAIFRSKKVMVVGDPSQIKPVLTLDSNVLALIGRKHHVSEVFVSADASTQTIVDATSQFGFQKNEDEWIGIPLWVHRRSNYPMFTISNEISYDGLMVQGKPENKAQGKAEWYDSSGKANDKFVKEQAELLKNLINKRLMENPALKNEIYVISPFRNVAYKLAQILDEINFTKREKGKPTNIGTVHTFQGKEAKIVYFVLGADNDSKGAAKWAVSDANMMNVATTRAKEEFYVIGDKNLYASLGSNVANKTISIIHSYNNKLT